MEQVLMREDMTDRTEQRLSAFSPQMAPFSLEPRKDRVLVLIYTELT